jgi:hypothetical protein
MAMSATVHKKVHSDAGKKQNDEKEVTARQVRAMLMDHEIASDQNCSAKYQKIDEGRRY